MKGYTYVGTKRHQVCLEEGKRRLMQELRVHLASLHKHLELLD